MSTSEALADILPQGIPTDEQSQVELVNTDRAPPRRKWNPFRKPITRQSFKQSCYRDEMQPWELDKSLLPKKPPGK